MANVLSHFCNVSRGETPGNMNRENTTVDTDAESTLYSGRLCHLDGSAKAVEGASGAHDPMYFAHRGVEHPDVAGVGAISSNLTGSVGDEVISLIPLRPGIRVQTSEYNSDLSYSVGDPVRCCTASGEINRATASGGSLDGSAIGVVVAKPTGVADGDGISVLDIEIIRAAPYL